MDMPLRECISGLQMEANKMTSANKVRSRRCLFGRPDYDELQNELKSQLQNANSDLRFIEAWNFDPQQDRPCKQGRFRWNLVTGDEYIPSFYRKSYQRTKFSSECSRTTVLPLVPDVLSRLVETDLLDTVSDAGVVEVHRENETTPKVRTLRTRIDDYMKKIKKRKLCDAFSASSEECVPTSEVQIKRC